MATFSGGAPRSAVCPSTSSVRASDSPYSSWPSADRLPRTALAVALPLSQIGVAMDPGSTIETWTPNWRSSWRSTSPTASIPNFEAW